MANPKMVAEKPSPLMTDTPDEKRGAIVPTTPAPLSAKYADESEFTEIRTEINFYNPVYGDKSATTGVLEVRKDPSYAPEGLIELRGIPLKRCERQKKLDEKVPYISTADGKMLPNYKPGGHYYVFCLTAPTLVKTVDKTWRVANPGEMVWVDERAKQVLIEEFLPCYPKRQDGTTDYTAVPSEVHEMILRPLRKDSFVKNGEARTAWKFEHKALRRLQSANWGRSQDVRPMLSYMPPPTPDVDPEDNEKAPF